MNTIVERMDASQIMGLESFSNAIDDLPVFKKLPLAAVTEDGKQLRIRDKVAVVNGSTNVPVALVTPGFHIVQHKEVARAVFDGFQRKSYEPQGHVECEGDGERFGCLLVVRPGDNVENAKTDVGDVFRAGVWAWNDLSGGGSVGVQGWAERLVCGNGRTSKETLGHFSSTHVARGLDAFMSELPERVAEVVDKLDGYVEVWNRAHQERIEYSQVPLLLRGTRVPEQVVKDVTVNLHTYEPMTRDNLTRATLYEAVAWYVNHVRKGPLSTSVPILERAHILLERDVARILEASK